MNWDAVIYWMGWAAAAAAGLMWYCEHGAHEHNLACLTEKYRLALHRIWELENPDG